MYETIEVSRHADAAAHDDGLTHSDLHAMVRSGTVIEDTWRSGRSMPTRVLLATVRGFTYHVVVGYADARSYAKVVTVYEPDPALWSPDFRRRVEA
jgi:hypothetical protein